MKRYKVAIVSDTFLPQVGGLEVHMHDLAEELTRQGHEAHVICAEPRQTGVTAFPVHRLDVPRLPLLNRIGHPESLHVLERTLRDGKYDIVHAHCIFSPLAHASTYLAAKLGIPSVFTLHSVLAGPAGVLFRLLNERLRWSTWPTILTGVSRFVADELRKVSGRDDVQVLPNAIRTEAWSSDSVKTEEARVVSVLRMTNRKRPLDIVRMAPNVLAQLPEEQWPKFTLIGDGPERARVQREIRKLGLSKHIELTGLLSRPQIRELLSRSSVFVLPSYLEALPIAVIEARAAGLPVVARTPNGVSEIVEHGTHGFLAENTAAFERYLIKLLRDAPLRARISAETQQNLDRFTWQRSIERHENMYALASEWFAKRHPSLRGRSSAPLSV
ncbi:MAG: glycosyltransferase family 4 protein [Myxococcales bacterium]|nr:glycosyltransferase family 4 protein [Myxococcales bacterium]